MFSSVPTVLTADGKVDPKSPCKDIACFDNPLRKAILTTNAFANKNLFESLVCQASWSRSDHIHELCWQGKCHECGIRLAEEPLPEQLLTPLHTHLYGSMPASIPKAKNASQQQKFLLGRLKLGSSLKFFCFSLEKVNI